MSFDIIDVRQLSEEELYHLELAQRIEACPDFSSRRQALQRIGGGALVAAFPSLLISGHAHAQLSDLARAIFDSAIKLSKGLYSKKEPIKAEYRLINQTNSENKKAIYNEIRSSEFGVTDQDYTYVALAPGMVTTVRHSGFEAKNSGENKYLAKTLIAQETAGFKVSV